MFNFFVFFLFLKQCKNTWAQFEKFIGSKVPSDVKIILSEAGYETLLSFASISQEDIKDIEHFIDTNRNILDTLNEYKLNTDDKFTLKPGHRSIIISLPKRMETFLEQSKSKRVAKKTVNKSDFELKTELINRVISFLKSAGFTVKLNIVGDVSEFKKFKDSYNCRLKCPYCGKKLLCTYSSNWKISNFETHLKVHTTALTALNANARASDSTSDTNLHT